MVGAGAKLSKASIYSLNTNKKKNNITLTWFALLMFSKTFELENIAI